MGSPPTGTPNAGGVSKNFTFFDRWRILRLSRLTAENFVSIGHSGPRQHLKFQTDTANSVFSVHILS